MATYVSVSRSCGFRASSAWLGPKAVARWLRDTCVNMTQDKVKLAKRAAEAYNRRDADAFAELATPDIEWVPALVRMVEGNSYRGREGIETYFGEVGDTWEELHSVAEEYRDLGDCVLVQGRLYGRGKGSGARVDSPVWNILDFRGGRIWRSRVFFDRAEALRAAGVSE